MRIGHRLLRSGQSDSPQKFHRGFPCAAPPEVVLPHQKVRQMPAHPWHRIEAALRLLKNDADAASPEFPEVARRHLENVAPLEQYCAASDLARRLDQSQYRQRER